MTLVVAVCVAAGCGPRSATPADAAPADAETRAVSLRGDPVTLRLGGPSDFWMFRAGPEHRGRVAATAPSNPPRLLWKVRTGAELWAQPVIGRDGTVYVGSFDHYFYAVSPSGNVRWRRDLGDRIYSTALLARGGRVYVGSDADAFYALTRAGRLRWRLDTGESGARAGAFDADTSAAPGPRGRVYFAAGPHLWAVDADGTVAWRWAAGGKIFSSPAVAADGTIWVGDQAGRLSALSPAGERVRAVGLGRDIDASPVILPSGDLLVAADGGRVVRLSPAGEERWRADVGGHVRASPAVARDGTVYVSTFGPEPSLVALHGATGARRWSAPLGPGHRARDFGSHSSPVVDGNGTVIVGGPDGRLRAFRPDGREIWSHETGGWIESSPALGGDGTIYVGSDDGYLYALGR